MREKRGEDVDEGREQGKKKKMKAASRRTRVAEIINKGCVF